MQPVPAPHIHAHVHSANHREEILGSAKCGCFYCLEIFEPARILDWIDAPDGQDHAGINDVGQTALCPRCGIDSVIGDKSGFPLTVEFLRQMQGHWFSAHRGGL
jgi:hypothetical protein